MTGPHLTPEREAAIALIRAALDDWDNFATLSEGEAARAEFERLLSERAAHNLTRTALTDSTALLAEEQWHARREGRLASAQRIDLRIQANQTVLGLAVAEADKPHHGNER